MNFFVCLFVLKEKSLIDELKEKSLNDEILCNEEFNSDYEKLLVDVLEFFEELVELLGE